MTATQTIQASTVTRYLCWFLGNFKLDSEGTNEISQQKDTMTNEYFSKYEMPS